MIVAKVEHFIKDGSRDAYVELMKELAEEIQKFDATAKRLGKLDAPEENHLLLEFASMDSFKDWHNSEVHGKIKQRLMQIISKQPDSTKFEVL